MTWAVQVIRDLAYPGLRAYDSRLALSSHRRREQFSEGPKLLSTLLNFLKLLETVTTHTSGRGRTRDR